MPRTVTVVLRTDDAVLGALPPFDVPWPFWPDVEQVVTGCRERYGLDVAVLRAIELPPGAGPGGSGTYLAQVDGPVDAPLQPWSGADPLAPHPLRAPYAEPDGQRAALAWADAALCAAGTARTGPPQQVKTWNLSAIWRLPTDRGAVWLKEVPAFFGHEPALVTRIGPHVAPTVLAAEPSRMLMADIPGVDHYDATGAPVLEILGIATALHAEWAGRAPELVELGLPDRRPAAALPLVVDVVERHAHELTRPERAALDVLVAGLDERHAALAATGLPDTLVHGDLHPGNVRGVPGALTVLDWGDAVIGHPAVDFLRLHDWVPAVDRAPATAQWVAEWARRVPGSDAARASELARPWLHLLGAVTYRRFLDHIEPSEHPFHAADPARCLRAAIAAQPSSSCT
ncbi:aminoglycoside phosphotransferase family protein [Pseudonocardia sp. CA-107938]|uniref:aminoglycoside phosphotransferase family protein n=1 Tax=Pseudonocardia sp. CA-107938 TaxID=3240021 RepID=UPI003D8DF474